MNPAFSQKEIDDLCQRRCSFALYKEKGAPLRFCMQEDGQERAAWGNKGFLIAPYEGAPCFIADERSSVPHPRDFPAAPDALPREEASTREHYHHLFRLYHSRLTDGFPLRKAVLARTQDVSVDGFSPARALMHACRLYPEHFNALIHTAAYGTWLCSTPEILLSGSKRIWQTMALAGTRPRDEEKPWDRKNRLEHLLVVRHLLMQIRPFSRNIRVGKRKTLSSGAVQHLCTPIRMEMEPSSVQALLQRLAPTPAVCGYPVQEARALIRAFPDIDRECYAGYLGPVSPPSCHLYVTLRCMQIFRRHCRLYAGGGLMPASDEEDEWKESEAKMFPMLRLIQSQLSPP